MSTTIDRKVVEMRFDNKHFEQNTKTTMSTLEKLKQKLNLTGASKGLEQINTSANKVNLNGLNSAVDTASSKFSALEIMGVTALANITNSAVNAGKRIVAALTIEPVRTGLSEYETQIGAIQTILSNTREEGTNVKIVNEALDELNKYADQTIYNFTEMTKNIGTFTAAGVKLDTSVKSIKGIANLAAVSGSTSQQASTAMYQLSQALAAGRVSLMDWNSVVNAGMGGKLFQNALIRTSEVMGTGAQAAIDMYGSFRESLTKGQWLTADVLNETLNQIAGAYSEADLIAQGYTKAQAKEIVALAKDAKSAAMDVKTFTQMWSVLKESAQSGWAQTWRIIVGDFEEAKALFTPLTKYLSGIIERFSNARNKLLKGALEGIGFDKLSKSLSTIFKPIKKTTDSVKAMSKSLETLNTMATKVIRGDFGNGRERLEKLTAAGYNYYAIQNKVNERLGYSFRYSEKLAGSQKELNKTQTKAVETTDKLSKSQAHSLEMIAGMSEEQLKAAGYTKEQIAALKELNKYCDKTGLSVREFVENIDEIDGRWLLINSFKNAGKGLESVLKAIGEAWRDAFPPMQSEQLFNIIAGLHKFSTHLVLSKDTAKDLTRTLKGVFAILDMISMVVGGAFKIAFTILKTILGMFNLDVLEFTAIIGDALVKIRDTVEKADLLTKAVEALVLWIISGAKAFKDWLMNIEPVAKAVDKLRIIINSLRLNIKNFFEGLSKTKDIGAYLSQGLLSGLKDNSNSVIKAIIEFGKSIIDAIKGVLGIHSPSLVFAAIGGFIIAGLLLGLTQGFPQVEKALEGLGNKCVNTFKSIDFGKILAVGVGIGMMVIVKKLLDIISAFAAPLNLLEDIGTSIKAYARGKQIELLSEAAKNLAISIAILAAAVYLLATIKTGDLVKAVVAIGVLAAVMGGLLFAMSKMDNLDDFKGIATSILGIVGIATALLIISSAMKKLSTISPDRMVTTIAGLGAMVTGLTGILIAFGTFVKADKAEHMKKAGQMIFRISLALLAMVTVIKLASKLEPSAIAKGLGVMGLFGLFIAALITMSTVSGEHAHKAGKMISKVAFSLLIIIGVIKLASMLKGEEIIKGIAVITLLGGFFALLIAVSGLAGKYANKAGKLIFKASLSLLILIGVMKLIGTMSGEEIVRGLAVISVLGIFFTALVAVSHLAGKNAIKAGTMLLMVSGALLILTGIMFLISKMDAGGLAKAVTIISILEVLFGGLMYMSKFAKDSKAAIMAIALTLVLLIGAVVGLTYIDTEKLLASAGSLTAVIIALGVLMYSMKALPKINGKTLGSLTIMLGVVSMLAGIIVLMSKINPVSAIESAGAISILLLTMSASLAIAGAMGTTALVGIAALALMTLVVLALGFVIATLNNLGVGKAMESVKAISVLLLAISATLLILSGVGALIPFALAGIVGFVAFIEVMVGMLIALGAIFTYLPKLEEFINKGIPILSKLGYALGSFLGNIVGGFLNGALSGVFNTLPVLGKALSGFMKEAQPFIDGVKKIDVSVLKGIGILAASIMALTAAQFINGIVSFLPWGGSLAQLGYQLSSFINGAKDFITISASIKPEMVTGIKLLSEAILTLTGANLLESISKLLGGESSLETFGTQLGGLGKGLNSFVKETKDIKPESLETAKTAAAIVVKLAEASKQIPNEGGWLGKIVGENDMKVWGDKLPDLAKGVVKFINIITAGKITKDSAEIAGNAADIIITLAEAASEIPNEGGWLGKIVGENDMKKFADNMPDVGTGIVGFINAISAGNITKDSAKMAGNAADIIVKLAEAGSKIDNAGGLLADLVGDNDLTTFANNMPDMGKGIAGFVKEIGTFDEAKLATVNAATKAVEVMSNMSANFEKSDKKDFKKFGSGLVTLAKKIASFAENMAEVSSETINESIAKINALINLASSVATVDTKALKTFGKSLKSAGKDAVNGFIGSFEETKSKEDATAAVEALITSALKGADNKKKDAKTAFTALGNSAISGLKNETLVSRAYQAGVDLCQGLTNGLYDATARAKVESAAYSLGELAVDAEKRGQNSASPSKDTEKAGKWLGEGLVIGIKKIGGRVYSAGEQMGQKASGSISNALNTALRLINSDVDMQPTIRPVLDLSEVESGAGYLNTMFTNPSIGVTSNLNAISSGMRAKLQNGVNDDVVSAIDNLRKDLGNTGGVTNNYNVNGVTYDDGSNITEAVKTIIRAAIIEGRV